MDNLLYNQVRCKKHEMILVTQTTATTGIVKPNKVIQWMQCKNCSFTYPLLNQQELTDITPKTTH